MEREWGYLIKHDKIASSQRIWVTWESFIACINKLATILMKTLLNLIFSIFLLIFFSCGISGQLNEKTVQSAASDSTTKIENEGNKIDNDKTRVLKSIYVIDRKGTEIKQRAANNSKTLGTYEFGAKLEVVENTEKWFGVRDRITREFLRNGSKIESTGWEKVYVLKNHTGSINDIALIPSDLNIISLLTTNQKTENFETGKELNDFLKIELINKHLFDSKKSSLVDFIIADTTENKKVNGIITLKCRDRIINYIDKPDAEEERQEFQYVGQIEFLNQYLIGGSYWESIDYRLIDKTNGKETQTFGEYPHISPDKKHIICIYTNPYETTADLELYLINNKNIKHKMSASFKNWMPAVELGLMFWSNDGYLYLAVNHVNSFWKEDGNINDKYQYLRIKIL